MTSPLAAHLARISELEREILECRQAASAALHERDQARRYLDTADVFLLAPIGRADHWINAGRRAPRWTDRAPWRDCSTPASRPIRGILRESSGRRNEGDVVAEHLESAGQERNVVEWRIRASEGCAGDGPSRGYRHHRAPRPGGHDPSAEWKRSAAAGGVANASTYFTAILGTVSCCGRPQPTSRTGGRAE